MVMGLGSIDQQVDDKKDMMRANPGMQGTVGKDLIGVMALQKLQKEKQAAENELMLAQQNNPSTIKEQLEREVAGLTQNEMVTQTAGILNQRQQQQQQRMQRPQQQQQQRPQGVQQVAQRPMGGSPRPMGGAPRPMPQAAGLAGAQRPPMMAAQGGIVGYNKGGVTISDDRLKELGMTRAQFEALTPAAQQALAPKPTFTGPTSADRRAEAQKRIAQQKIDRRAEKEEEKRKMNEGLASRKKEQARAAAEAAGLQIAEPAGTIGPEEMAEMNAAAANVGKGDPQTFTVDQARKYVRDQYNQMADSDTDTDTDTTPTPTPTPTTNVAQAGGGGKPVGGVMDLIESGKLNTNTAPTKDQLGTIGQEQASSRLDSSVQTGLASMASADPVKAMKDAQASGDKRYNVEQGRETLEAKRDAYDAEMKRRLDPNELKKARLRAGAIQRGGLAGARARAGERAEAQRLAYFKESADNYANDMKADVEKLKAVDTTAAKILEMTAADRRTAMTVFASLAEADQAAVTADKDRFQAQNEAALTSILGALNIETQQEYNRVIKEAQQTTELTAIRQKIADGKQQAITKFESSVEYMNAPEQTVQNKDGSLTLGKAALKSAYINELDKRMEALEMPIIAKLSQLLNMPLDAFLPKVDELAGEIELSESELLDVQG